MMAQSRAESTRDTYNYGQYLNQFPPNTIKVIREFERIQKKICRHKMSIMFNEICIYIYISETRWSLNHTPVKQNLQINLYPTPKQFFLNENIYLQFISTKHKKETALNNSQELIYH